MYVRMYVCINVCMPTRTPVTVRMRARKWSCCISSTCACVCSWLAEGYGFLMDESLMLGWGPVFDDGTTFCTLCGERFTAKLHYRVWFDSGVVVDEACAYLSPALMRCVGVVTSRCICVCCLHVQHSARNMHQRTAKGGCYSIMCHL